MIDVHYWPTPNGKKVTILLEEWGPPTKSSPATSARATSSKTSSWTSAPTTACRRSSITSRPAAGPPISIFESGAIMMYIAEKAGKFWPQDLRRQYEVIQWVMWQMANQGPKLGECGHFRRLGDRQGDQSYAVRRFTDEANRLYGVLNNRLYDRRYLAGDEYTIADMIAYPWTVGWEAPGPGHRRVQVFQALVRGTGRAPRREARHGGDGRSDRGPRSSAGRRTGTAHEAALQPARPARPGGRRADFRLTGPPRSPSSRAKRSNPD